MSGYAASGVAGTVQVRHSTALAPTRSGVEGRGTRERRAASLAGLSLGRVLMDAARPIFGRRVKVRGRENRVDGGRKDDADPVDFAVRPAPITALLHARSAAEGVLGLCGSRGWSGLEAVGEREGAKRPTERTPLTHPFPFSVFALVDDYRPGQFTRSFRSSARLP